MPQRTEICPIRMTESDVMNDKSSDDLSAPSARRHHQPISQSHTHTQKKHLIKLWDEVIFLSFWVAQAELKIFLTLIPLSFSILSVSVAVAIK
jgi:hypothetical protein